MNEILKKKHTSQVPEYFQNKALQLIIFGGKGGVGKTTMASAAALYLSRSRSSGEKILIISTDPAHSLSDCFGMRIGDQLTPISIHDDSRIPKPHGDQRHSKQNANHDTDWMNHDANGAALFAQELDSGRLLGEFKKKNEAVIKKIAYRGTYFDHKDIADFFDLSLPGMDEVMAIMEMAALLRKGHLHLIILDTAPTGHTVRMLNLPEQMQRWVEVVDLMQQKYRYMVTQFSRKNYVKDECDRFLDNLSVDIKRVYSLLTNQEITRFVPVTIPEPMVVDETKRLLGSLEKLHIPVKEMIVNRVIYDRSGITESENKPQQETATNRPWWAFGGCKFCMAKKAGQAEALSEIENFFLQYQLIKVPVFPNEIREVENLKGLAECLSGVFKPFGIFKGPTHHRKEKKESRLELHSDLEIILVGGKGGVGKTTLASAVGLHLAKKNPHKKYLVFSTDPAHSLSDSFKMPIGDRITPIPYTMANEINLFAGEIDATERFEDFRRKFKNEITEMFDTFFKGEIDVKFDREVMSELFTLAPPGLDEVMAMNTIMDLRDAGKFDTLILDTSPTGHLIRFLELPMLAREWLNDFFRLLLKYKGIVRLTRFAEAALSMSKGIKKIQNTIIDSQKTTFIAVAIPEAMSVFELERLITTLMTAGIPCKDIIVNMIVPETDCGFCIAKRTEQMEYLEKMGSQFSACAITEAPLFPHEVRGPEDLQKIGEIIFSGKK